MKQALVRVSNSLGLPSRLRTEFITVLQGRPMSNELYSTMFKELMPVMPYEVAKARSGDPEAWIVKWMKTSVPGYAR